MTRHYRWLRSGERVPEGVPMRAKPGGYVRLRWKIGLREYVDAYEHRIVNGLITDAEHVHHRDGQRGNNNPENLAGLSELDHHAQHARFDIDEAIRLFRSGVRYKALAARYRVHWTTILRRFQRRGVDAKAGLPLQPLKTHCIHGHELTPANVYLNGRHRRCRECTSQRRKRVRLTRHEIALPAEVRA